MKILILILFFIMLLGIFTEGRTIAAMGCRSDGDLSCDTLSYDFESNTISFYLNNLNSGPIIITDIIISEDDGSGCGSGSIAEKAFLSPIYGNKINFIENEYEIRGGSATQVELKCNSKINHGYQTLNLIFSYIVVDTGILREDTLSLRLESIDANRQRNLQFLAFSLAVILFLLIFVLPAYLVYKLFKNDIPTLRFIAYYLFGIIIEFILFVGGLLTVAATQLVIIGGIGALLLPVIGIYGIYSKNKTIQAIASGSIPVFILFILSLFLSSQFFILH